MSDTDSERELAHSWHKLEDSIGRLLQEHRSSRTHRCWVQSGSCVHQLGRHVGIYLELRWIFFFASYLVRLPCLKGAVVIVTSAHPLKTCDVAVAISFFTLTRRVASELYSVSNPLNTQRIIFAFSSCETRFSSWPETPCGTSATALSRRLAQLEIGMEERCCQC